MSETIMDNAGKPARLTGRRPTIGPPKPDLRACGVGMRCPEDKP